MCNCLEKSLLAPKQKGLASLVVTMSIIITCHNWRCMLLNLFIFSYRIVNFSFIQRDCRIWNLNSKWEKEKKRLLASCEVDDVLHFPFVIKQVNNRDEVTANMFAIRSSILRKFTVYPSCLSLHCTYNKIG